MENNGYNENDSTNGMISVENDTFTIKIGDKTYSDLVKLASFKSEKPDSNIVNACVYGKTDEVYEPILVVETKDNLLAKVLIKCATYYPIVYFGDINGDEKEEVIVNNVRTAMGIGVYKLQVFEIRNELISLYDFPKSDYIYYGPNPYIPYEELNFGFSGELLDGYKMSIKFPDLNYEKTIQLPQNKIDDSFYSESGTALNKNTNVLEFNTFFNVELVDVDSDGVFEIVGTQHVSYGIIRSIGHATVVLKYIQSDSSFEPIKVEFTQEGE